MTKRSTVARLMAVLLGAGLAACQQGEARAQYPPVVGNVAVEVADATPALGEEVEVTAVVLDAAGEPAGGVECTFGIAGQPGDDAAVEAGPFTTADDGTISTTLQTGSTAGTILVEANCGELQASVSLVAGAATGPGGPAEPPASLPDTGGGTGQDATWPALALMLAGLVIGVSGIGVAWRMLKT
jgi:hypothetical protein